MDNISDCVPDCKQRNYVNIYKSDTTDLLNMHKKPMAYSLPKVFSL